MPASRATCCWDLSLTVVSQKTAGTRLSRTKFTVAPIACGFLAQSSTFRTFLANQGIDPNASWHFGFGAAAIYLFATATHTGFLGVLLTLSKTSWYPVQTAFAEDLGDDFSLIVRFPDGRREALRYCEISVRGL